MKRGDIKYVPFEPISEIGEIKIEFKLSRDADAFRKMAELSAIGREISRALDFAKRRRK